MSAESSVNVLSETFSPPQPQFHYRGHDVLDLLKEARNYNRWLAAEVAAAKPTGARYVVDLGAGCGTFSELLRARGINAQCIEPDAANQRELRRLGFVVRGDLEELDRDSVDYIFTLNVLEHVAEDAALAAAAFARLRRGGRFFVFVPAFPMLWSALDDHVQHVRRYRRLPLVSMLQRIGFQIEGARYVDSIGFFAALGTRWLKPQMSSRNVALYDRVLFPISRFVDPVLGLFVGKNLLVVCRRP